MTILTDKPAKAKLIDLSRHKELDIGATISDETREALRKIDANIYYALNRAGRLPVN